MFDNFRAWYEAEPAPRLLDLGTGTGAMLRRVLEFRTAGDALLSGLDSDPMSLESAAGRIRSQLEAKGRGRRLGVRLVRGDLLDAEPATLSGLGSHDLVTALLRADGDELFERSLLAAYDQSMEARRLDGEPTADAFSGRRFYGALRRGKRPLFEIAPGHDRGRRPAVDLDRAGCAARLVSAPGDGGGRRPPGPGRAPVGPAGLQEGLIAAQRNGYIHGCHSGEAPRFR